MKKVYAFTLVKDEDDIIEDFIRYNSSVVDVFFIYDNGSSDNTLRIIEKLKQENYKIELFRGSVEFDQIELSNYLVKQICESKKYLAPDFIIGLDCDEFFIATGDRTVTEVIDSLSIDKNYTIDWRLYILEQMENDGRFFPEQTSSYRKAKREVTKVLVPFATIDDDFIYLDGNHSVSEGQAVATVSVEELKIAHYPIRSKTQYLKKMMYGYINRVLSKSYVKGRSAQIERGFYYIKSKGKLTLEYLQDACLRYCNIDNDLSYTEIIKEKHSPFSSFRPLMKYRDYTTDLQTYNCNYLEILAERYRIGNLERYETCDSVDKYSFKKVLEERALKEKYLYEYRMLELLCEKAESNDRALIKKNFTNKHILLIGGIKFQKYMEKVLFRLDAEVTLANIENLKTLNLSCYDAIVILDNQLRCEEYKSTYSDYLKIYSVKEFINSYF